MKCPECNGENLTWEDGTQNTGGAVDGRFRASELQGIFILGCNDCSETVKMVLANDVADYLNAQGIHSL